MISISLLIISLLLGIKHKRLAILCFYWLSSLSLILVLAYEGIEAAYQISSKPSDSLLYFTAFTSSFETISTHLFYQYPLFLKVIIYPFDSAYFALIGQSACLAVCCLWALRNSHQLLYALTLLNHTLIYTTANFFKDNYILTVALATTALLDKVNSKCLKSCLIIISVLIMAQVRPFTVLFMPLAAIPYMFSNKNIYTLRIFWIGALSALSLIIYDKWALINHVASNWSSENSVGTQGLSASSLPKIILGPTPFHYYYSENHFIQPFLHVQSLILTGLHYLYYFALAWLISITIKNFKVIPKALIRSHAALFSMGISLGTMLVYLVAYGSADIRQRAIILVLLFVSFSLSTNHKNHKWWYNLTPKYWAILIGIFTMFYIISVLAI